MESKELLDTMENSTKVNNRIGDHKWDKYLDDYFNYFKEYKKHYNKSVEGNSKSLSIYPYMQQKWESLKRRIGRAHKYNRLNDKQIERLIVMKIKEY